MINKVLITIIILSSSSTVFAFNNDKNNQNIERCVQAAEIFFRDWIDEYYHRGTNAKGKCFIGFSGKSIMNGTINMFMNSKESKNYVASMELHKSKGPKVYPGIVTKLRKCEVSEKILKINSVYKLPQLFASERQVLEAYKNERGRIVKVKMRNHRNNRTDTCNF